jgi:pimeloyl-ACP methyl ester carboxylesterase
MQIRFSEITDVEQVGHLRVRTYGDTGPHVIVLHGGPAAVGSVAPIARGLADAFRVIEPWQRGSGVEPLTVDRHVEDLQDIITACTEGRCPALVGWSWGAMLALAFAAAHAEYTGPIVLIGCGTFDRASRKSMHELLRERIDDDLQEQLERLEQDYPDQAAQLQRRYELTRNLYDYEPLPDVPEDDADEPFDARAHTETWDDMICLQELGVYPAAFAEISSPVLMLHGAYDPHPGAMVYESLRPYISQLEYREWERCGHSPWVEKYVHEEFFLVLHDWLMAKMSA